MEMEHSDVCIRSDVGKCRFVCLVVCVVVGWIVCFVAGAVGCIGALMASKESNGQYADDAPQDLEPHGRRLAEPLESEEIATTWSESRPSVASWVGRRVVLIGRVRPFDFDGNRFTLYHSTPGRSFDCEWAAGQPAGATVVEGQPIRISGVYRIRQSPLISEGCPKWAVLEACRVEP